MRLGMPRQNKWDDRISVNKKNPKEITNILRTIIYIQGSRDESADPDENDVKKDIQALINVSTL